MRKPTNRAALWTGLLAAGFCLDSAWCAGVTAREVHGPVTLVRPARAPGSSNSLAEQLLDVLVHRERELSNGMGIVENDQVVAQSEQSIVQLECASGATQTLSGKFNAVVHAGTDGRGCILKLLAGTALATETSASDGEGPKSGIVYSDEEGDVTISPTGTQFGAAVTEADDGGPPGIDAFVIDGEITVARENAGEAKTLSAGQYLPARAAAAVPISEAKIMRYANVYARLDVATLPPASQEASRVELQTAYANTFRHPAELSYRAALTTTHAKYDLAASPVGRYEQSRLRKLSTVVDAHNLPSPGSQAFESPMQNGFRVDYCLHWGVDCGQPAADAWCATQGFARAQTWTLANDIGAATPTWVAGDSKACNVPDCDGFAMITCSH